MLDKDKVPEEDEVQDKDKVLDKGDLFNFNLKDIVVSWKTWVYE